jgi:hypothetical protein
VVYAAMAGTRSAQQGKKEKEQLLSDSIVTNLPTEQKIKVDKCEMKNKTRRSEAIGKHTSTNK